VIVEDASSGISLLQELQLDTDLPLRPQKISGDKLVRAAAAEPTISAGRVMLPEGAPWAYEFLQEVCAFPSASHDDYVDALVYAIVFLRTAGAVLTESDRQFMASANQQLHSAARGSSTPRGDGVARGAVPEGFTRYSRPDLDAEIAEDAAQSSRSVRAWGVGRGRFGPGTW
jgi:hypothetical protein